VTAGNVTVVLVDGAVAREAHQNRKLKTAAAPPALSWAASVSSGEKSRSSRHCPSPRDDDTIKAPRRTIAGIDERGRIGTRERLNRYWSDSRHGCKAASAMIFSVAGGLSVQRNNQRPWSCVIASLPCDMSARC